MEKTGELCRELREKKGYTYKKIAQDLKINPLTLKTYVYKGVEPRDPKVVERVKRYFKRELTDSKKVEEKPLEEEKKGIKKRFRELVTELGKGDATKGMKTIMGEMKLAESSFGNWYYQEYTPKTGTLNKLADYFTKKLKRRITPEYLLGKEETKLEGKLIKPEEKAKKEEKPKPVIKKKGEPKSEKPVAKPEEEPKKPEEEAKKEEKPKPVAKPKEKPTKAEEKPRKPTIEPEGLTQLIERCEALTSALREYTEKEKALVLSDYEKELIKKFRKSSDDTKKGLMLLLK